MKAKTLVDVWFNKRILVLPTYVDAISYYPFLLYILTTTNFISSLLANENEQGYKQAVYYLSRTLTETKYRYTPIEKLCLCLYFSCIKLKCYLIPIVVCVIYKIDLIKYMLSWLIIREKISKWMIAISEFSL